MATEHKIGTDREFLEWCSKHGSKHVGKPQSYCDCPLANWLSDINSECITVGMYASHRRSFGADIPTVKHHRWMQRFIDIIDGNAGRANLHSAAPVTGDEAAGVMKGIIERTVEA